MAAAARVVDGRVQHAYEASLGEKISRGVWGVIGAVELFFRAIFNPEAANEFGSAAPAAASSGRRRSAGNRLGGGGAPPNPRRRMGGINHHQPRVGG